MRRALVVALGIGLAGILGSPPAQAHASFGSSEPAPGQSLEQAPGAVSITFTEEPDPALSRIEVFDTAGGTYHEGRAEPLSADPRTLRVEVDPLGDGVYTVSWRVVSKVDGHLTSGGFAFGVGVSPDEIEVADIPEAQPAGVSPAEVAGRFGFYSGLVVLVGASWLYALAFRTPPRRGRRLVVGAVGVAVAGTLLLGVAQLRSVDVELGVFLGTSLGGYVVWRLAALAVAAVALLFLARRWSWWVLGGAALAAMAVHISGGHAASGPLAPVRMGTQFVHLAAAGVWIGGLLALLAGLSSVTGEERERVVGRFSAIAGVALGAVVVTGSIRAINEVSSFGDLFGTGYGRVIVAKVVLLVGLVLMGRRNRRRNVPVAAVDAKPLRRLSMGELGVAAAILVLTGMLAALPPPAGGIETGEAEPVVAEGTDLARSVEVRLQITPGRAGPNLFEVWVEVLRGPEVEGVRMRVSPLDGDVEPSSLTLTPGGSRWAAQAAAISIPGRWEATVVVDRGAATIEVPLQFHTACAAARVQEVGELRLFDIELGGGRTVQSYVDPGTAGGNEAHFTFFGADGREMEVADEPVVRALGDSDEMLLEVRRAGPGHFTAGGELESGRWLFSFAGETEGGDQLHTCFADEIS